MELETTKEMVSPRETQIHMNTQQLDGIKLTADNNTTVNPRRPIPDNGRRWHPPTQRRFGVDEECVKLYTDAQRASLAAEASLPVLVLVSSCGTQFRAAFHLGTCLEYGGQKSIPERF
ncbi:hypothetical protein DFH09DRAFT_1084406 [Mycena vulgaris]|nr:hypothetical protein DFH09DRAFT_1084406 [Mycena vulgaris]